MFIFIKYFLFFFFLWSCSLMLFCHRNALNYILIILIIIIELAMQSINFESMNQKEISFSHPVSLCKGGNRAISCNGEAFQQWNIFCSFTSSCLRLPEDGLNSKYRVWLVPLVVVIVAALSSFWAAVAPCWRTWSLCTYWSPRAAAPEQRDWLKRLPVQPTPQTTGRAYSRTNKHQRPREIRLNQNNNNF